MKIRLNALRLTLAGALVAAALCQSCVRDVELPEVPRGEWVDVPTPPNVYIETTVCVSDRAGALYMGSWGAHKMWRSTDRGLTWTEKTVGLHPSQYVEAIVVKEGAGIFAAIPGGGVFLSRDRGDNWIQVNNHLTDLWVRSLAVGPGGELIAGASSGGVFRSVNDGAVWTEVPGKPIGANVACLITDSAGVVYAGSRGVFYSTDAGLTWISSSEGLEGFNVACLAIDNDGAIFAGGYDAETYEGEMYRSPGPGEPWVRIDVAQRVGIIRAISIDRAGGILAGTTGQGVLFSGDGGVTWEQSEIGIRDLGVNSLLCLDGAIVAGTSGFGALRSTDGGRSWILAKRYRFIDAQDFSGFQSLSVDSCGAYYLVSDRWGGSILRSRDGGETWMIASSEDLGYFRCLAIHPNGTLIAGTERGIWISNDSGDNWSRADTLSPWHDTVWGLDVAGNGTVLGLTSDGVIRSFDGGSSWEHASEMSGITSLCAGADSCVYAGSAEEGVLKSGDFGATWKRVTDSLHVVSVDADRIGNVFALLDDGGMLCSADRGESWSFVGVGSVYSPFRLLAAPGGEMALVLDAEGNLYESENCFRTWKTVVTPYRYSTMFLGPDGRLYINELDDPALHRSREPLFDVAATPSLFRRR